MQPATTPAMQAFLEKSRRSREDRSLATEGFARAFYDATGLQPHEAEMVVEEVGATDHIAGSHVQTHRIWFQRRR